VRPIGGPALISLSICLQLLTAGLPGLAAAQCDIPELQRIVPPGDPPFQFFARSIARSGDVLCLGCDEFGMSGSSPGEAYIYRRLGGEFVLEDHFTAPDSVPADEFGIASDAARNVVVIGALQDSSLAPFTGLAYVFRHDGTSWVHEQKLTASDGSGSDLFGRAIATRGDLVVCGALKDSHSGLSHAGSAYVFRFDGTGWVEEAKLIASDASAGDEFGYAVSMREDRILVGARYADRGAARAGAAYVFRFLGGAWKEEQILTASDAASEDLFGAHCALGDDVATVGAWGDDDHGEDSGSAYVFRFDGRNWLEEQKLLACDGMPGDRFGWAVSIDSDIVAVGAFNSDRDAINAGAAYVWWFDGTRWIELPAPSPLDAAFEDSLGFHLEVEGEELVVGAPRKDSGGNERVGAAYVFSVKSLTLLPRSDEAFAGDTITRTIHGGRPSGIALLSVTEWNGLPVHVPIALGAFDSSCALHWSAEIPPGLAGNTLVLVAFGEHPTGEVKTSNFSTLELNRPRPVIAARARPGALRSRRAGFEGPGGRAVSFPAPGGGRAPVRAAPTDPPATA